MSDDKTIKSKKVLKTYPLNHTRYHSNGSHHDYFQRICLFIRKKIRHSQSDIKGICKKIALEDQQMSEKAKIRKYESKQSGE